MRSSSSFGNWSMPLAFCLCCMVVFALSGSVRATLNCANSQCLEVAPDPSCFGSPGLFKAYSTTVAVVGLGQDSVGGNPDPNNKNWLMGTLPGLQCKGGLPKRTSPGQWRRDGL